MEKSIVILLIIGAAVTLAADIFSNMIRVMEIREVKRDIKRFEKAFYRFKKEQEAKDQRDDVIELIVKEEESTLPKFGEF